MICLRQNTNIAPHTVRSDNSANNYLFSISFAESNDLAILSEDLGAHQSVDISAYGDLDSTFKCTVTDLRTDLQSFSAFKFIFGFCFSGIDLVSFHFNLLTQ